MSTTEQSVGLTTATNTSAEQQQPANSNGGGAEEPVAVAGGKPDEVSLICAKNVESSAPTVPDVSADGGADSEAIAGIYSNLNK